MIDQHDLEWKVFYTGLDPENTIFIYNNEGFKEEICSCVDLNTSFRVKECLNACKDITDPSSLRKMIFEFKSYLESINELKENLEWLEEDIENLAYSNIITLQENANHILSSITNSIVLLSNIEKDMKNQYESYKNIL